MSLRFSIAALMLAGCAGSAVQAPSGAVTSAPAAPAAAQFNAARPQLRRIGYRNCDGYAIELFAPARVSATTLPQQSLYLNAYAYRSGGAIRLNLPGAASRLQRQTAAGWQDLPMVASAGGGSVAASVAAAPLVQQLGQSAALQPGHYRTWLAPFSASRSGGASCAITPVWQFDLS